MAARKSRGKVIICTPFLDKPTEPYLASLEASAKALDDAGYDHGTVYEIGNVYISNARANCLRRALNGEPDMVVFIDYDLSWSPADLLKLIRADAEVAGGTYRFKKNDEEYMGEPVFDDANRPVTRADGCMMMKQLPAGFLKITRPAINQFMEEYPDLVYGDLCHPYVDLFNHGAKRGRWYGEDYAFCVRWRDMGKPLWCVPDVTITHHHGEHAFSGNFHDYHCRRPGGSKDPARLKAMAAMKDPEILARVVNLNLYKNQSMEKIA